MNIEVCETDSDIGYVYREEPPGSPVPTPELGPVAAVVCLRCTTCWQLVGTGNNRAECVCGAAYRVTIERIR